MGKIISFMHVSLDGFVAGPNGEMNWIKVNQEIFDYVGNRITKTNTALYGRKTFEMMESYWPTAAEKADASKHDIEHAHWYKNVNKIVLSTTLEQENFGLTTIIGNDIERGINKIKQLSNEEILLFGSPKTTHSLFEFGLIDGFWMFVNPIVLGNGIPLFNKIKDKMLLNLISTKLFDNGVVELNYLVDKNKI